MHDGCLQLRLRVDKHHLFRGAPALPHGANRAHLLAGVPRRAILLRSVLRGSVRLIVIRGLLLARLLSGLAALAPAGSVGAMRHNLAIACLFLVISRQLLVYRQSVASSVLEQVLLRYLLFEGVLILQVLAALIYNLGRFGLVGDPSYDH